MQGELPPRFTYGPSEELGRRAWHANAGAEFRGVRAGVTKWPATPKTAEAAPESLEPIMSGLCRFSASLTLPSCSRSDWDVF